MAEPALSFIFILKLNYLCGKQYVPDSWADLAANAEAAWVKYFCALSTLAYG
ncbi:MAG: hypothetical protein LBQ98_00595 [Nitrososphaerota archaeon]|jgi:hypothetical protein|nr:hypothetical protein [Nitrososphaerota archaeon]